MKKSIIVQLLVTSVFLTGLYTSAQKKNSVTDDFSVIKNEKQVNLVFIYDKMTVGELPSEAAYIEKRAQEYNEKKPGRGDVWIKEWKEIKERAEIEFAKIFNKKLTKKYGITVSQNQIDPTYTLVLNMLSLEIGWSAGLVSRPAILVIDIWLCKSLDLQNPLATMQIIGYGASDLVSPRIAIAYRHAATRFTKVLRKTIY